MQTQRQDVDRFCDPGVWAQQFTNRVLVHCPRCDECAIVMNHLDAAAHMQAVLVPPDTAPPEFGCRLRCPNCGLFKDEQRVLRRPWRDPHAGFVLWLRAACRGRTLWAYNLDHLALLESYIAARLHESGPDPDGMLPRLPGWLISAKHRDEVLRAARRLRVSVPPYAQDT
ncbi:hypothetical protein GCM10009678_82790 [Actinomadura kijaniata]|uniref:Putative C2H2 Zn-finger protein n=1 Tax=Actinomadura namibiensis TaxID=182080 RepID=A0A7W3QSJ5_ACTNM|nr:hypothetical protein [Actinomadura namibiensis]MBA8957463.1 putative C2H2 Zn-finger protein [Actinomadura namibiensis]